MLHQSAALGDPEPHLGLIGHAGNEQRGASPMISLKKTLLAQGMKLLSDPRVLTFVQDERVVKVLTVAMNAPSKAQTFAKEQASALAKVMALATKDEVRDLRRTVRRLEDDLARLRSDHRKNGAATGAREMHEELGD